MLYYFKKIIGGIGKNIKIILLLAACLFLIIIFTSREIIFEKEFEKENKILTNQYTELALKYDKLKNQLQEKENLTNFMLPVWLKYSQLEKKLQEVAKKDYTNAKPSSCFYASHKLQEELKNLGYETVLLNGDFQGGYHQWIALEIEPQTGDLITRTMGYKVRELNNDSDFFK